MSITTLLAQHMAVNDGPSPFQQEFLKEQVCNVPILGKVVRRIFIGV